MQKKKAVDELLLPGDDDMDDLELSLEREVILLAGTPGGGKSYSVTTLIADGLEEGFRVVVLDRDRGLRKAIKEVFGNDKPRNMKYFRLDEWDKASYAVDYAFENLRPGDWFVSEMIGNIWDFAQTEYSRMVYGEDLASHMLILRTEAQEAVRAAGLKQTGKEAQSQVSKVVGYSGLDGRQDWSLIKRMHNNQIFDRLIVSGNFNVLSTTSMIPIAEDELAKHKWPEWEGIGKRPEGEKHQSYRHDTLMVAYKKGNEYFIRTDLSSGRGKDRGGRELFADHECTGIGAVRSYKEYHNLC